jgi:hypothetical protein
MTGDGWMHNFIGQTGSYIYRVGGDFMAREDWAITDTRDGGVHVSASRDASAFGVWLGLEATQYRDGRSSYWFELRQFNDGPVLRSARFWQTKNALSYASCRETVPEQISPDGAHFFPLMRCFTGAMIHAIMAGGGACDVIVPDISALDRPETAFAPRHSQRRAIVVKGAPNAFDLSGGAYEAPARVYLNEKGLLDHYTFEDGSGKRWTCDLEQDLV